MPDLKTANYLNEKIRSAGGNLIAVSKKFPATDVAEVYGLGIRDFGENYVSEALEKMEALRHLDIRWHFIGRVQTGNLNKIINKFYLIHSVYKIEHLKKINGKANKRQKVLLQIQHSKDERGFGLKEEDLFGLLEKLSNLEKIDFAGLMFIAPPEFEAGELKEAFKWAAGLLKRVKNRVPELGSWDRLSMGMSADYEWALKEGATDVRIGTAIFGNRN